jgi:uncharacterized low-complexity protein
MSDKDVKKPIAIAVSAALAATFGAVGVAQADNAGSPFEMKPVSSGYQTMGGHGEGNCGEGNCGEGKCGEGSGGEGDDDSGDDGEGGGGEGACGEGKCGGSV